MASATNPEVGPLKTLDEVMSWHPTPAEEVKQASVRLPDDKMKQGPYTLVCHDMKGGYIEDRFVDGCDKIGYRFYHWHMVDIFVYFSHHFITIPPPGWTNSAHRHCVKVLGTLITEWDDGKSRCSQFLQSSRDYRSLANKLASIMKYYGFDGWLVNIENVIEENKVDTMRDFVVYLTERCHSEVERSQVIWYDSVIRSGELKWQDQLNEENRMFFDVCDGIFLNYCWNDTKLESSCKQAGPRLHDVYVGVDVFGRGCPGGGGYNTCEAMKMIRKHDLSAAIFAPGWVMETQETEEFTANQNRFWGLLTEYCTSRHLKTSPFLASSFCQGFGQKYFREGKVVNSHPWYNLSLQQHQPTSLPAQKEDKTVKMELYEEDGYLGGGCLLLKGVSACEEDILWFSLFQMNASISSSLFVMYTVKSLSDVNIRTVLKLCLSYAGQMKVVYLGESFIKHDERKESCQDQSKHTKLQEEELWIEESENQSSLNIEKNNHGWKSRCYQIKKSVLLDWNLQSVSLGLSGARNPALLLGQIQVLESNPEKVKPVRELRCSNLQGADNSSQETSDCMSLSLEWNSTEDAHYYNVYHVPEGQEPKLKKQCVKPTCSVSVPHSELGGTWRVQTVTEKGVVESLEECASCDFSSG